MMEKIESNEKILPHRGRRSIFARGKALVKSISKSILALLRIRPADFVVVVFLDRLNFAFLAISKNGNSSIKEAIVASCFGTVDLPFEVVHEEMWVSRKKFAEKGIRQELFFSKRKMRKSLDGKSLLVVHRPVLSRLRSAYQDLHSRKNRMMLPRFPRYDVNKYRYRGLSFDDFCKLIVGMPDYLSDQHFRSQTFFWDAIPESCHLIRCSLEDLDKSFNEHPLLKKLQKPKMRNVNTYSSAEALSSDLVEALRARFSEDIARGIPFEG